MQIIKFVYETEVNHGTESEPEIKRLLTNASYPYSSENLEKAKSEAYNGEIAIEDDGQPEPEPSREEKLEAKIKALTETNAMLEECIVEMAAVVYA